MRNKFAQVTTRKQAFAECPWAAVVVKVAGGYQCFESADDARVWKNQK